MTVFSSTRQRTIENNKKESYKSSLELFTLKSAIFFTLQNQIEAIISKTSNCKRLKYYLYYERVHITILRVHLKFSLYLTVHTCLS